MEKPTPDASMICRVALGEQLISRDAALAIFKLVIADCRGADELRAQEPIAIEDGGKRLAGNRQPADPRPRDDGLFRSHQLVHLKARRGYRLLYGIRQAGEMAATANPSKSEWTRS